MAKMGSSKARQPVLQRSDHDYIDAINAAREVQATPGAVWTLYLMLVIVVCAIAWAALAQVDMVTRSEARVVPDGHEQIIASLEGGILHRLLVREGDRVELGQPLAELDPTRFEAQQNERQVQRIALRAAIARLRAEAAGEPLQFDADLKAFSGVVAGETASYDARKRALDEAVEGVRRSASLLSRELGVAESMSAKGLMSEVEVMRLRRQINDLQQQSQERINRFRQDASAELVRQQTVLTQLDQEMVASKDMLTRTVLRSPVRGLVKSVKANTVGGVVTPGAPVMEIVPLGEKVLIEMRIKPADIGFIQVGQAVETKLSAYEFTVYGSLRGTVTAISPDALGDPDRPDNTWYRAMVSADVSSLKSGGKPLAVIPGMTGMAEVKTGQRSVLSYLLRPFLKSREAFQER